MQGLYSSLSRPRFFKRAAMYGSRQRVPLGRHRFARETSAAMGAGYSSGHHDRIAFGPDPFEREKQW